MKLDKKIAAWEPNLMYPPSHGPPPYGPVGLLFLVKNRPVHIPFHRVQSCMGIVCLHTFLVRKYHNFLGAQVAKWVWNWVRK